MPKWRVIDNDPPDPPDGDPPPKGNSPASAPGIDESLLTAENGKAIPIVYGTVRVDGNIIERFVYTFASTGQPQRQKTSGYNQGDILINQGNLYIVQVAGVTGAGEGPTGTSNNQVDGVANPPGRPTLTSATPTAGGSLANGTYYYVIAAVTGTGLLGDPVREGSRSNEQSAALTGANGSAALTWSTVGGATGYRVYRGIAPGAETLYYSTAGTSFTDTGAAGTSATPSGPVIFDYVKMGYRHKVAIAYGEGLIYGAGKAWQDKNVFAAYTDLPHDSIFLDFQLGTTTGFRPPWWPIAGSGGNDIYGNTVVLWSQLSSGSDADLPTTSLEIKGIFADATHVDANPADIITDLLTHARRGAAWPAGRVDSDPTVGTLGNLASGYRKYCTAYGFLVSWAIDSQTSALSLIATLLAATNAEPVMTNRLDGLGMMMKVVPLGDQPLTANGVTFTPNTTPAYALTADDFLSEIEVETVQATETYNSFPIEYVDRATDYKRLVVDDPDMADVDVRGLVRANATSFPLVMTPDTAIQLSRIKAQRDLNVRNIYRLELGHRFLLLEPTDLLTESDGVLGINGQPVRVVTFEEDQESGSIRIEAKDFPTAVGAAASYTPQVNDPFKPLVSTALGALSVLPGQAPTSVVPDSTSTRGAMVDNLIANGNSENPPPDGVDATKPEWAGRVNVGAAAAFAGSWARQLTALQNAQQLIGDQPPAGAPASYQSQLGWRIPCSPGETFYIEAMIRWAQAAATQNAGAFMYFVDANGAKIGQATANVGVAAPTLGDFDSLLNNGGGETGTVGVQATNWTLAGGNGLLVANDFALFGSKSLKITNAGVTDSYSYQDFSVIAGQEYELTGWIRTSALPAADAGVGAILNVDIVSGVTGYTIIEKSGVGTQPAPTEPDVGIVADGAAHDWTFVKCRFIPTGANGTLRLYCSLGYAGGQSGTAWFDGLQVNTYQKSVAYGVAPPGTTAVHLFVSADSNLGNMTCYVDAIYARRQIDGNVVSKMGSTFVDEVQYGSMKALGRSVSGTWPSIVVDRAWYRGNCAPGTLGGAPNISKLTLKAVWDTPRTNARFEFALQPAVLADNLDGMRYAKIDVYRQSARGTGAGITVTAVALGLYVPLPDRLYKVPGTDSDAGNLTVATYPVIDGGINANFPAAIVTLYNVNGPSDTHCFYAGAAYVSGDALVDNGQVFPAGWGGAPPTGGGGGGGNGGGNCLDPETPVLVGPGLLAPIRTVRAGDLLWTRPEDGGPMAYHAAESVLHTTNLRCRVSLRDGRAFTCSVNHLLKVRGLWQRADWLTAGTEIEGDPSGIVRDVEYLGEGPVVQLRIPTAKTYFAGDGCWHHNTFKP